MRGNSFVKVDMRKTLEELGLPDETELCEGMGIDENDYIPALHVYFNDDLTYG